MQLAPAILVVGPSWVGDMVMAQSLFKLLKHRLPDHAIDVVAPSWSIPVLDRMAEVRKGYALEVVHGEGGLGKRYRLGKQLRDNQYSQAIVLPRSLKSALVPFFAKIPRRTGFRGEMRFGLLNDIRPFDKATLDQTVKKFSYLGLERASDECKVYQPELIIDSKNAQLCLSKLGLNPDKFTVALMPGAEFGPAKQWPLEHFSELIRRIDRAGAQAWLFGSKKESAAVQQIIDQAKGAGTNLCGKTQLADAIDLIAQSDVAVANDSGLMHVAAAAGTRLIAIYGSSSPLFTPPLTDDSVINWLELDCSPCFQRECRFGHYDCLNKISPGTIFEQLEIRDPDTSRH
ncbi:MAG: lipopolysaccharide heptosyltransferase II [Proteobacteria bacterium]|nr:lipopolysaccharide heptosyltransferase II [Pseudomonadota bacterium]